MGARRRSGVYFCKQLVARTCDHKYQHIKNVKAWACHCALLWPNLHLHSEVWPQLPSLIGRRMLSLIEAVLGQDDQNLKANGSRWYWMSPEVSGFRSHYDLATAFSGPLLRKLRIVWACAERKHNLNQELWRLHSVGTLQLSCTFCGPMRPFIPGTEGPGPFVLLVLLRLGSSVGEVPWGPLCTSGVKCGNAINGIASFRHLVHFQYVFYTCSLSIS